MSPWNGAVFPISSWFPPPGYSPLQLHHNVPISEAPEAAKPPETDSATEKLILGEHALSVLSVLPNVNKNLILKAGNSKSYKKTSHLTLDPT